MNGRTLVVLGAVGLGLYLLRKESGVVTSMMGEITLIPPDVAAPTPADLQAKLVAGAQAVEDISSAVVQLPPLQYAGKITLGPS
jgi:hypothetical protein